MGNDIRLATLVALLSSLAANAAERPSHPADAKSGSTPAELRPPVDFALTE